MYLPNATQIEFDGLIKPHISALQRTAFRMTKNETDAEDLFQETLYKAFRAFNQFERNTNFRAWIFRILVNTYITSYRKMRRQPQRVDFEEYSSLHEQEDMFVSDYSIESEVIEKSFGDEVTKAINKLPYHFKLIVMLYDVEDFSYNEIAEIADIPLGTVMSRLHRGRSLLRRYLQGYAKKYNHTNTVETENENFLVV